MGYTLTFVSQKGATYTVAIDGGGTALVGSADPVYIEEDDSTDIFAGVKTQSGYINIIDTDGSTWRSIAPISATSKKVVITRTYNSQSTVVWRGFLKPETYGGYYLGQPQVMSLPIVCPLSVLSSIQLETNPNSYGWTPPYLPTFAELVTAIFDELAVYLGVNSITLNLPNNNQDFYNLYNSVHVQWGNLVEIDDDGLLVMKYNHLELLGHICNFFGMTCRYALGQVYFAAPAETNWLLSTPVVSYIGTTIPLANVEGTDELIQGIKRATVRSDINEVDSILPIPFDKILEANVSNGVSSTTYPAGGNGRYYRKNSVGQNYDFGIISIRTSGSAAFEIVEYIDDITGMSNIIHDWTVRATLSNANGDSTYMRFSNPIAYALCQGKIRISGSAYLDQITDGHHTTKNVTGNVKCRLKIGNLYWSGYSWTEDPRQHPGGSEAEEPSFFVMVHNGSIGKGDWHATQDGQIVYDFETIYTIPVTKVQGPVTFEIISGLWGADAPTVSFRNLSVTFSRGNERSKSENVFRASNSVNFANQREQNLIFASDGMLTSYGLGLLTYNGDYLKPYTPNNMIPEEHLADTMASWGSKRRRVLTLPILNDDAIENITPFHIFKANVSDWYHPVAISHDYWNDITTVKLIEL